MAPSGEADMPFIRNLAAADRITRTKATETLKAFLASRRPSPSVSSTAPSTASSSTSIASTSESESSSSVPPTGNVLTDLDARKLWKGLFYAMWMCDRAVPQQNLAADLAAVLGSSVDVGLASTWLRAFWHVMSRQWVEIDVLRMEKFMLLVRRVLAATFQWAATWLATVEGKEKVLSSSPKTKQQTKSACPFSSAEEVVRVAVETLTQAGPLSTNAQTLDQDAPVGLRLHVLDIWVDELERTGFLADGDEPVDANRRLFVEALQEAVEGVSAKTIPNKVVRNRAHESLGDERLASFLGTSTDTPPAEEEWGGFDD